MSDLMPFDQQTSQQPIDVSAYSQGNLAISRQSQQEAQEDYLRNPNVGQEQVAQPAQPDYPDLPSIGRPQRFAPQPKATDERWAPVGKFDPTPAQQHLRKEIEAGNGNSVPRSMYNDAMMDTQAQQRGDPFSHDLYSHELANAWNMSGGNPRLYNAILGHMMQNKYADLRAARQEKMLQERFAQQEKMKGLAEQQKAAQEAQKQQETEHKEDKADYVRHLREVEKEAADWGRKHEAGLPFDQVPVKYRDASLKQAEARKRVEEEREDMGWRVPHWVTTKPKPAPKPAPGPARPVNITTDQMNQLRDALDKAMP